MIANSYKVLIVEDEDLFSKNLFKKIESTNLNLKVIHIARNGKQAIDFIKENIPDIIISDIQMPVMNGLELVEYTHTHYPAIQTIFLSGYSDFEYAKQGIRFDVCDYLLKPIDAKELYDCLHKVLYKLELIHKKYDTFFTLTSSTTPNKMVELLHSYIQENFTEEIDLNLLANKMNYSPNHLTKTFQKKYDITPSKFIASLRLQKAQHLLTYNKDLNICQISEILGYQDQAYFSRIFKKQTGLSPFEYREQICNP